LFLALIDALTQKEIDNHLDMGKRMLAAGQLADSLTHYHAAVGKYLQIENERILMCFFRLLKTLIQTIIPRYLDEQLYI
jgi:hypothetical protein